MSKDLTLYFYPGFFEIEVAAVNGREIMVYLDNKNSKILNEYIEEINILAEGGYYDRI